MEMRVMFAKEIRMLETQWARTTESHDVGRTEKLECLGFLDAQRSGIDNRQAIETFRKE